MHILLIYNILSLYFSDFYVLLKSQFCPPVVPQTLEGHNFFCPFLSLGHFEGQKQLFLGVKHSNTKIYSLNANDYFCKLMVVFVFDMIFFVNFLSPENIFHKYSPTFYCFISNLVTHIERKTLFINV